jgi:hypothetical protein
MVRRLREAALAELGGHAGKMMRNAARLLPDLRVNHPPEWREAEE